MSGTRYAREPGSLSKRITTGTTTAVKAASGVVRRIIIGTTAAGTITINDSTGTLLVLGASYPVGSYQLDLLCSGKIEIVTGAASDITVIYN